MNRYLVAARYLAAVSVGAGGAQYANLPDEAAIVSDVGHAMVRMWGDQRTLQGGRTLRLMVADVRPDVLPGDRVPLRDLAVYMMERADSSRMAVRISYAFNEAASIVAEHPELEVSVVDALNTFDVIADETDLRRDLPVMDEEADL